MLNSYSKDAVRARLKALFDAVYEEAAQNPEFFSRLEEILLSPEIKASIRKKASSTATRPSLNVVEILHEKGESGLRAELENCTTNDLVRLCAQESIRKQKDAKNLERGTLIELLLQAASNRLKQGDSFIKRG